MTGKWSQAGVPQRGWVCDGVEDLGAPDAVCQMCEVQDIRYVHTMSHPNYDTSLEVGCVCAEHMEEDYVRPRLREQALKSAASRKKRWLSRRWFVSTQGNAFVNTAGFNVTITKNADNSWGGRILERATGRSVNARRKYETQDLAKLAAFDGMIFLKMKRGWGE
ncbi:MAG: hypothetical protein ACOY4O_12975 [Pseudomonadota bacterium]